MIKILLLTFLISAAGVMPIGSFAAADDTASIQEGAWTVQSMDHELYGSEPTTPFEFGNLHQPDLREAWIQGRVRMVQSMDHELYGPEPAMPFEFGNLHQPDLREAWIQGRVRMVQSMDTTVSAFMLG